jgi:hypothetical protein
VFSRNRNKACFIAALVVLFYPASLYHRLWDEALTYRYPPLEPARELCA